MKNFLRLLMVLTLLILFPFGSLGIQAKEINKNIKIAELTNKVDFEVFSPDKILKDSTLEIKTYSKSDINNVTQVRLHYINKADQVLLFGIEQSKISNMSLNYSFYNGEKVDINGEKGYFKPFINASGGILSWVQDGTYIEMDSSRKSKEEMMIIARSMKAVKQNSIHPSTKKLGLLVLSNDIQGYK